MTRALVVYVAPVDTEEVVEKQLPITDPDKVKLTELRREIFNDTVNTLAENLYSGKISLGEWEESMKKNIRDVHASVTSIVKGGWDTMTHTDWGRTGTPLREQYKYLHNFANYIFLNKDTISLKAIQARARLYGLASSGTAAIVQAGPMLESMLPWMPRDGSTKCLMGCKCMWKFKTISKDPKSGLKVVSAIWKLNPAEHCDTCIDRKNHEEILTLPIDYEVPAFIGGY